MEQDVKRQLTTGGAGKFEPGSRYLFQDTEEATSSYLRTSAVFSSLNFLASFVLVKGGGGNKQGKQNCLFMGFCVPGK